MRTVARNFLSLILISMILSCSSTGAVEKPDNLIKESVLERVLYDIIVLEAMSTFKPKNQDFESVYGKPYIYKKYGIDSLQLVESDNYYAKFPRIYTRIYSNIQKRMGKVKDSLTELDKLQRK
jgi:hypothetical protein